VQASRRASERCAKSVRRKSKKQRIGGAAAAAGHRPPPIPVWASMSMLATCKRLQKQVAVLTKKLEEKTQQQQQQQQGVGAGGGAGSHAAPQHDGAVSSESDELATAQAQLAEAGAYCPVCACEPQLLVRAAYSTRTPSGAP
jgi:hypothetical protein